MSIRESETTIKIKFALFTGGVGRGAGRKIVQNAFFRGKRHDNKILKVKILLSRNFVVMAQAPRVGRPSGRQNGHVGLLAMSMLQRSAHSFKGR